MKYILVFLFLITTSAVAQPIVADVSQPRIEVTTNFDGAEVVVFGATEGKGEVVVVVQGPMRDIEVRKKEQVNGMWLTGKRMIFKSMPTVYHIASSRPTSELGDASLLKHNEIGFENIHYEVSGKHSKDKIKEFHQALLDQQKTNGFYSEEIGAIHIQGGRLFRSTITLPPDVPTGSYRAEAFLFQNGTMVTAQLKEFEVRKVGFSAGIYNFATQNSFFYGLVAVAFAFMVGVGGAYMFKSR